MAHTRRHIKRERAQSRAYSQAVITEGGRIVCGIRNFRFNQNILEMLSNVELLGPAVRAAGEESFEMVVPAMKIRDFHFSEVTKF